MIHIGAIVAAMGFSAGCSESLPPSPTPVQQRWAVLCLVNAERRAHGLRALVENRRLEGAAQAHTRQMVRRNYISHTGAGGTTPLQRIRSSGYLHRTRAYSYGENIAVATSPIDTPADIVQDWMNSARHRAQILNPAFRDSGIGFVSRAPRAFAARSRGVIFTQDFGSRA